MDGNMDDQHETIVPCYYHVLGYKKIISYFFTENKTWQFIQTIGMSSLIWVYCVCLGMSVSWLSLFQIQSDQNFLFQMMMVILC